MRTARAVGCLLGLAAGDALGAGYEFRPPLPETEPVLMRGGGAFGWEPGQWTDDTSMAVPIARAAADGLDLRDPAAQDRVAAEWYGWAQAATDVGAQTAAVLGAAGELARAEDRDVPSAAQLREAARRHHDSTGRSGGNGSLMRTAPVALACLDDEDALVEAATALSALTHWDPEAGEACVLWCLAIGHAVGSGELDVRRGLARLPAERRAAWTARLDAAEAADPSDFPQNGWVVQALQAAWCAIASTSGPDHLSDALEAAVRAGHDTDTVAAIAGSLLGAAYGAAAVPEKWTDLLHGWPGIRAAGLVALAERIVAG